MGAIKTSKLVNGNIGLEITYGGLDAPFGGIDVSMPPRYIDPNCFANSAGFLVLNGKLRACGFFPKGISLTGFGGNNYLGSGSFYANGKYRNWTLGYTTATGANFVTITYNIWVWDAGTVGAIALTASCSVTQYEIDVPSAPATAKVVVQGTVSTGGGTVTITVGGTPIVVAIAPGDTTFVVASNLNTAINTTLGYPCTSVLQPDGLTLVLTTTAVGAVANSTTLVTAATGLNINLVVSQVFAGGYDGFAENFGIPISPLSWVAVGETLYFGGAGSMILKYNEDSTTGVQFGALTQYLGAVVLQKYNSQLIAAGIVTGPGLVLDNPEMIIGWSAPNGNYGTWNPTDANGLVTGAGFAEEADISDYITGMFIIPGAALILRTQGADYVTALQNGVSPFDFQHISDAKFGEGCQDSRLQTQYDRVGFYIGNSDIYAFDGQMNAIGAKIKNLINSLINQTTMLNRDATAGVFKSLTGSVQTLVFFTIDLDVFVYNTQNKTWMKFDTTFLESQSNFIQIRPLAGAATVGAVGNQFNNTFNPVLTTLHRATIPFIPLFYDFQGYVQNSDFFPTVASYVVFPEEEISFGRDITIDGLFVSAAGTPGQQCTFSVSGMNEGNPVTLTATFILPATATPDKFVDYQVFFDDGAFTGLNPQLRLDVPLNATGVLNSLVFQKIAMFGSFDPEQRPV